MEDKKLLWLYVYAYTVGFQQHPGAGRGDHKKLTMRECAKIADDATTEYKRREQHEHETRLEEYIKCSEC